jgi:hypothetical protein
VIGAIDHPDVSLSKVEQSLILIKTYDRRRYERLRRDLERILVHLLSGDVARFNPSLRACELDTRFVLEHLPEKSTVIFMSSVLSARWCTP